MVDDGSEYCDCHKERVKQKGRDDEKSVQLEAAVSVLDEELVEDKRKTRLKRRSLELAWLRQLRGGEG